MTDTPDMAAIKARLAAITPDGGWLTGELFPDSVYAVSDNNNWDLICENAINCNAEFIASAPADMKWLVGRVKEESNRRRDAYNEAIALQARVEELEARLDDVSGFCED